MEMKINDFLKSMENSVIQYIVFDFRSVKPGFIKHVILVWLGYVILFLSDIIAPKCFGLTQYCTS